MNNLSKIVVLALISLAMQITSAYAEGDCFAVGVVRDSARDSGLYNADYYARNPVNGQSFHLGSVTSATLQEIRSASIPTFRQVCDIDIFFGRECEVVHYSLRGKVTAQGTLTCP